MITLECVEQRSGTVLDRITLRNGTLHTETGAARPQLESLARTRGQQPKELFQALADGGWSNGYTTIRKADTA